MSYGGSSSCNREDKSVFTADSLHCKNTVSIQLAVVFSWFLGLDVDPLKLEKLQPEEATFRPLFAEAESGIVHRKIKCYVSAW